MGPLADEYKLDQVSYDDWMARLEKSGRGLSAESEVEMMRRNPALKIFDFFKDAQNGMGRSPEAMGLPLMDVSVAAKVSRSLRDAPMLTVKDALRWLCYWRDVRFIL